MCVYKYAHTHTYVHTCFYYRHGHTTYAYISLWAWAYADTAKCAQHKLPKKNAIETRLCAHSTRFVSESAMLVRRALRIDLCDDFRPCSEPLNGCERVAKSPGASHEPRSATSTPGRLRSHSMITNAYANIHDRTAGCLTCSMYYV